MNDVCDPYDALLERISYMEACFVDRSTVIFETIQLSSETIDGLFSGEKHPILSKIYDIICSLAEFPFDGSAISQHNFLSQLVCEADYSKSPAAIQELMRLSAADWTPLVLSSTNQSILQNAQLYKFGDGVQYIYLKQHCAPFDLSTTTVVFATCRTLKEIIHIIRNRRWEENEQTLQSSTYELIKRLMYFTLQPLLDVLESAVQQNILNEFDSVFS